MNVSGTAVEDGTLVRATSRIMLPLLVTAPTPTRSREKTVTMTLRREHGASVTRQVASRLFSSSSTTTTTRTTSSLMTMVTRQNFNLSQTLTKRFRLLIICRHTTIAAAVCLCRTSCHPTICCIHMLDEANIVPPEKQMRPLVIFSHITMLLPLACVGQALFVPSEMLLYQTGPTLCHSNSGDAHSYFAVPLPLPQSLPLVIATVIPSVSQLLVSVRALFVPPEYTCMHICSMLY